MTGDVGVLRRDAQNQGEWNSRASGVQERCGTKGEQKIILWNGVVYMKVYSLKPKK